MKNILFISALLVAFLSGYSQVPIGCPTCTTDIKGTLKVDSLFLLPLRNDTLVNPGRPGALVTAYGKTWIYMGTSWALLTGVAWGSIPGNITNQLDLMAMLNAKQNQITNGYAWKLIGGVGSVDTAILRKVDTVLRVNDSTLGFKINGGPQINIVIRGSASGTVVNAISISAPPALFSSPVVFTSSAGSWNGTLTLIPQSANTVWAGPTSGSADTARFRQLVPADLPTMIPNGNLSLPYMYFSLDNTGTTPNWDVNQIFLGGTAVLHLPYVSPSSAGIASSTMYNFWSAKVDSTTQSNDSVYEWRNGLRYYRYFNAGGGGTPFDSLTAQGGIFHTGAYNDSRYRTPLDTAYGHLLQTRARGQQIADSLSAIFNSLFKLSTDSVRLSGYTTIANKNKLADSLRAIFNIQLLGKVDTGVKANIYIKNQGAGVQLLSAHDSFLVAKRLFDTARVSWKQRIVGTDTSVYALFDTTGLSGGGGAPAFDSASAQGGGFHTDAYNQGKYLQIKDSTKYATFARLYKTLDSLNLIVLKKGDSTLYSTFARLYKVVDSLNLVMIHKGDSAGVGYTTLARTRKVIDSLGALITGGGGGGITQLFGKGPISILGTDTVKYNWYYIEATDSGYIADGQEYRDGSITTGTNILTSSVAHFTAADVGKYIEIGGSAAAGAQQITTVSGYTNSTTITVASTAGTTVTGTAHYKYGTDNTIPLQKCLNTDTSRRAINIHLSYGTTGRALFTQAPVTNVGGFNPHSILYIPRGRYAPSAIQRVVQIYSDNPSNPFIDFAANQIAPNNAGLMLEACRNDSLASFLAPCPDTALYGNFNWTMLYLKNLIFRTKSDNGVAEVKPLMSGLNLAQQNYVEMENVRIQTSSPTFTSVKPDTTSYGLFLPTLNNGGNNHVNNVMVQGYGTGIIINENTNLDNISVTACNFGLRFDSSYHTSLVNRVLITWCPYKVVVNGTCFFSITQADIEHYSSAGPWFQDVVDVDERNANNTVAHIGFFIQLAYGGQSIEQFTRNGNFYTSGVSVMPTGFEMSHNVLNGNVDEWRVGGGTGLNNGGTMGANLIVAAGARKQVNLQLMRNGVKDWTMGTGLWNIGTQDWFLYNAVTGHVELYVDSVENINIGGSQAHTDPYLQVKRTDSSTIIAGQLITNNKGIILQNQGTTPALLMGNLSGATNTKWSQLYTDGATTKFMWLSDALSSPIPWISAARGGDVNFPNGNVSVTNNLAIGTATTSTAPMYLFRNANVTNTFLIENQWNGSGADVKLQFKNNTGSAYIYVPSSGAANGNEMIIQNTIGNTKIFTSAGLVSSFTTTGNQLLGTTTADVASSILTMGGTTKGFLPPKLTTTQQNAISSPATGLVIWNTDSLNLCVYNGTAWRQVSYTAGAGFANPMTTVGDIIYGGTSGSATRLAGNTTTARQFYTSTGTGSAATAPTLGVLVSGDIPNNAANTSGTAANLSGTPLLPTGTAANTGSTGAGGTNLATQQYVENLPVGKVIASTDQVAQTSTTLSLAITPTPSATGTFRVGGYLNITVLSVNTATVTVTWTDVNSLSRSYSFATALSATGFYPLQDVQIRALTGTQITVQVSFSGAGSQTYDFGATIEKLR